ncbi:MAG TPA: discoidin domain-containing protein [Longimicrobiales bacterium]
MNETRKRAMVATFAFGFAFSFTFTFTRPVGAQTLDNFEDIAAWQAAPASGVEMHLSSAPGHTGNALQVDFDFHGGGGWAALRHKVPLQLPENYEISFWLKGAAPRNTLEFKLVDPSGENVWWVNRPEFEFSGDWRRITLRKRHFTFAWGPRGGGEIREAGAIELAITAGHGGKGTVWLDDMTLTPREPVLPYTATPVLRTSANTQTIDFTRNREFGGIVVDWKSPQQPRSYDIMVSTDGKTWQAVRSVRRSQRDRDYVQLPESEARYLRVAGTSNADPKNIRNVRVMPLEWGASANAMFETIAADAPRGWYPKYFRKVQSYWTLAGLPYDSVEALINEEGAVEFDKRSFSLEPFLYADGKLITWAETQNTQSLAQANGGTVPIPTVTRTADSLQLATTVWAEPVRRGAAFVVRYQVGNTSRAARSLTLYVAARPFQVNPSSQFLNSAGGATRVRSINAVDAANVWMDGKRLRAYPAPARAAAVTFDQGDIVQFLARGVLPRTLAVRDTSGFASAALAFPLVIAGGATRSVDIVVTDADVTAPVERDIQRAIEKWDGQLSTLRLTIPDERVAQSIRSNLGYILLNADGPAIQPGSRSYERSWIRDGSLTSAALLRLGHAEAVKRFIEWYAPFQYADGKVPCCVDRRGADPVPENDSHGELIYLITEYFRFTGDTAFARRMYPHVERAVAYMDSLRQSRRTAQYRGTGYWGMLPQSISHEGYSAKPMHSYWDDFFALKGFKDAAWLAQALGDAADAVKWAAMRDEFQADLVNSFEWTLREQHIDWLAGAVELGDFDATSTTVGVNPAGAQHDLPQAALMRTFDKYWENFVARRDSSSWDAYTPYEWRVVGTLVRLGERRRAHALLDWFMQYQRPAAWRHWAEVVYRDSAAQHFIGDMPHTWVGSDFIRSVLDMFAYVDNDTLIIGAGIIPQWLQGSAPISIDGLHTPYGVLAYTMKRDGSNVVIEFRNRPRDPQNGFVIRSPLDQPILGARADGRTMAVSAGEVQLRTLPRTLILSY